MNNISMKQLVDSVVRLGTEGGGAIDVTGTWRGKERTIHIQQTEWCQTPVCLIGGYGHDVSAITPNMVSSVLDCVVGNYLDGDEFIIEQQ